MAYQMEVQLNLTHFLAPKTLTCSTNAWINDDKWQNTKSKTFFCWLWADTAPKLKEKKASKNSSW